MWRMGIVLAVLSTASVARAQDPRYQMIHEGKHWTWFAREDQFKEHKADIAALYDYADKAFDKLCESWGLKPPRDRYTLLVMARPGGGFAAGNISEARAITGKESPGIGCSYDAFFGTAQRHQSLLGTYPHHARDGQPVYRPGRQRRVARGLVGQPPQPFPLDDGRRDRVRARAANGGVP